MQALKEAPLRDQLTFIGLASAAGVIGAASAVFFLGLLSFVQDWLYNGIPMQNRFNATEWWWIAAIMLASTGVIALARRLPGGTGEGPLTGFHFSTEPLHAPGILLAALATLAAGITLGPEAPLIIVGTTVVALATRSLPDQTRTALMFLGGLAAIGVVFGSPVVTVLIVIEFIAVGLAPAAMLVPALAALTFGTITQLWMSHIFGIHLHSLVINIPVLYEAIMPFELLVTLVVAALVTALVLGVRWVARRIDRQAQRFPGIVLWVSGVVIAGIAVLMISVLGFDPRLVLFSGNSGMTPMLMQTSAVVVLLVVLVKAIMFALALGGGFRGGPIFPATFLGLGVAVALPLLMSNVLMSPLPLATAGIAAAAAAFTGLPGTSAVLAVLLMWAAGPLVAPFALLGSVVGWIGNKWLGESAAKKPAAKK